MNAAELAELQSSGDFDGFLCGDSAREYLRKMSVYFFWRVRLLRIPADPCDFEQIAALALWESVRNFEWRCPKCQAKAGRAESFQAHCLESHGKALRPSRSIFWYVHKQVGTALYRESRRHLRRAKITTFVPPIEGRSGKVEASQDQRAELAWLLRQASKELDELSREVLFQIAEGERRRRPKSLKTFLARRAAA